MTARGPALSVVIPIFDEEDSIEPLYRELDAALTGLEGGIEIISLRKACHRVWLRRTRLEGVNANSSSVRSPARLARSTNIAACHGSA